MKNSSEINIYVTCANHSCLFLFFSFFGFIDTTQIRIGTPFKESFELKTDGKVEKFQIVRCSMCYKMETCGTVKLFSFSLAAFWAGVPIRSGQANVYDSVPVCTGHPTTYLLFCHIVSRLYLYSSAN